MTRHRLPLILQCLIFLIPLNIYMWGDWLLVNVQWALFRYQQSPYGNSLILGYKDILYMYFGQNTGFYNIAAASLWTFGSIILLIRALYHIFCIQRGKILPSSKQLLILLSAEEYFSVYQRCVVFIRGFPFLLVSLLFFSLDGGCTRACMSPMIRRMKRKRRQHQT